MNDVKLNSKEWLSLNDLPNEEWKDVKGYENIYMASTYGRIKSLDRYINVNKVIPEKRLVLGKILKQNKCPATGYLFVNLYDSKGHKKPTNVHRIIGMTFLKNSHHYPIILHKDDNKQNNKVSNLKWGTYSENIKSAYDNGLNGRNKHILQYTKNDKCIREYSSITDASIENNILISSISNCLSGLTNTAGGYKWKYKEREEN